MHPGIWEPYLAGEMRSALWPSVPDISTGGCGDADQTNKFVGRVARINWQPAIKTLKTLSGPSYDCRPR
jgi:hypothetical protein